MINYRRGDPETRPAFFKWKKATPGTQHSVISFVAGWNAAMSELPSPYGSRFESSDVKPFGQFLRENYQRNQGLGLCMMEQEDEDGDWYEIRKKGSRFYKVRGVNRMTGKTQWVQMSRAVAEFDIQTGAAKVFPGEPRG